MSMKKIIRRGTIIAATSAAALALSSAPATAHVVIIDPPGQDPKEGCVGGPALPGKGQGLIPGGPPNAPIMQSPAHGKGLNTACETIRAHGNGVVDIFGPPTQAGCAHGT